MTDYVKALNDAKHPFHREANRLAGEVRTEATVTHGVIRWNSNGRVPFDDVVALAAHVGLDVSRTASNAARDKDVAKTMADYRERMKNHKHSPEELFEMRAAFGPGATVVNAITGKRTKLRRDLLS